MFKVFRNLFAIALFFCAVPCHADETSPVAKPEESIKISKIKGGYELTVPVSQLVLTLNGNKLAQFTDTPGYANNGPRYFYFRDETQGLIISGWFEPQQGFPGIKQFWKDETGAWKEHGLPEPLNVAFETVGKWDTIAYDIKLPETNNTHLRAHWLQAGTWIDLHLSLTSKLPNAEGRAKLESILKSFQVREKPNT